MKAVIMAGGKGTRFWPRSTEKKPKQFRHLTSSSETMLKQTYRRFADLLPESAIYVVAPSPYIHFILEQLPDIKPDRIIVEPDQRDTGPCQALIASYFLDQADDEVLVVAPSDHYIPDGEGLGKALLEAEQTAKAGPNIVTLGVVPTRPETGYGYMVADAVPDGQTENVRLVKTFIEKPAEDVAEQLIRQNNVFWNSGILIWKPSTAAHYMNLYQGPVWKAMRNAGGQLAAVYSTLPKISIDYAVLEKADRIYTIPVSFEWDDVGTWTSLQRIHLADPQGNILIGDVQASMTENSIIFTETLKTVVIGVSDLIVVSSSEGLLVCHKSNEQQIKKVLEEMFNRKKKSGS